MAAHDRPLLGIGLMIMGMSFIPVIDICAKLLSADFHPLQISWSRFFFHVLWLLPILLAQAHRCWPIQGDWRWHLGRGLSLMLATIFFFVGISMNSIPATLALLFISPLVVTLTAPLLLRERFVWSRLLAALLGFSGVLVVLRPGGEFQPSLLFGVLAGCAYASYLLFTRKLTSASSVPPALSMLYVAVVGSVLLLPALPGVWQTPDWRDTGIMALMGLAAVSGHYLILFACRCAEASLLAPFTYSEMVGATVLSYLFFDFWPQLNVWVGVGIICSSGIYISISEMRARKKLTPLGSTRV